MKSQKFLWYVIASRGYVLAVYGSALKADADAKFKELCDAHALTSAPIRMHEYTTAKRPRVGAVLDLPE